MDDLNVKFLVITANIGSLFEEYGEKLQENWVASFHKLIEEKRPTFLALHFQEVGGKSHQVSTQQVRKFFKDLYSSECFCDYVSIQSHVDEDYEDSVKYTALGCVYFVHKMARQLIQQWNFLKQQFVDIADGHLINAISEDSVFIKKLKFPLSCYSKHATKLPRKGFTVTKWKIQGKVFVLLNIHLTHDACNITVTRKNNTKYAKYRKRSLEYTLNSLNTMDFDHTIIFGDFNVRPDTKALLDHVLGEGVSKEETNDLENGKTLSLMYRSLNGCSKVALTIQERQFEFNDYEMFNQHEVCDLLKFDKEFEWLFGRSYCEAPIKFRPTYPHKENPCDRDIQSFANVRCPAWCDRVLLDKTLYQLVESKDCIYYEIFGEDVVLGDHKPVYMTFTYPVGLRADQ